jgi:hypothetical protein
MQRGRADFNTNKNVNKKITRTLCIFIMVIEHTAGVWQNWNRWIILIIVRREKTS